MPAGKRCGGAVGRVDGACEGSVGTVSVVPKKESFIYLFFRVIFHN